MAINVIIPNVNKVADEIGDKKEFVHRLASGMNLAVKWVHQKEAVYPPPPVGSQYVRTGTLGRSIDDKVKTLGNNVVGVVGSPVVYSPYVIGDKQAKVHRGRWVTLRKRVLLEMPAIRKFLVRALQGFAETVKGD